MYKSIYALKNTIVTDSSSGAAFPTIENSLRKKNKMLIVYGVAFDVNMKVCHFRADNESDTKKFRGSKYIESDMSGINQYVANDLLADENEVLFTGTPCQVSGLKRYLMSKKIPMDKLVLVDVLCHGTPSRDCWKNYLNWLEKKHKAHIVEYSFRSKGKIIIKATLDNGKTLVNTNDLKMFFDFFNSPRMIQEKCFKCHFAGMKNESDITIGDFWGIEKVMPEFPYKKGVSIVIVNTNKGMSIISNMILETSFEKSVIIGKCENNDVIKYNPPLQGPTPRTKERDLFLKNYKKGWTYLYNKYCIRVFLSKVKHLIIK